MKEFREDWKNFQALADLDELWCKFIVERSPFRTMRVMQVKCCLDLENWHWTPRGTA